MKKKRAIRAAAILLAFLFFLPGCKTESGENESQPTNGEYIKWIDFKVPYAALTDALAFDVKSYGEGRHVPWTELLSLYSAQTGGNFSGYKKATLEGLYQRLRDGEDAADIAKNTKLLEYYRTAYGAVLGGMVGEYTEVAISPDGNVTETEKYGLRVFSPIAAGYYYQDYDDFGAARSYGYKRNHLGHDLLGSVGTPVVAVESGYVEHLGWNQYGGWRIGIRSMDGKRYYYYAHLCKDHPFAPGLYEGQYVNAGEVIGYLGMTGYSVKENVNGINTPHLHYGLQIIFDASQIDGWNQIWIDLYDLTRLLSQNRAGVCRRVEDGARVSLRYYRYPEMPD